MKKINTFAKVATMTLALVGLLTLVAGTWIGLEFPSAFAKPNTFTVIETYSSSNAQTPSSIIYLEAPSSLTDLSFDGALRYSYADISLIQGKSLLKGVIVSGSGAISFGKAMITVEDGVVGIDGHDLCSSGYVMLGTPGYEIRSSETKTSMPREVVVGRNGWYHGGRIRLGNGLISRLLYR